MSELNPYAKFLAGRSVDEVLSSTPGKIATLLNAMGEAKICASPAPGKWSPAQIVWHLSDCELVFSFRLRQTLAEDNYVIQPFDQEKWAAVYPKDQAERALDLFTGIREWNLMVARQTMPAAATRKVTHPERGVMTFQTILESIAGHDLNHLGQLERIAQA